MKFIKQLLFILALVYAPNAFSLGEYLGDFNEDDTVRFILSFQGANGAPINASTDLENDDIKVYKNNGTSQRATADGFTVTHASASGWDGITGLASVVIDTSVNTGDAGFWVAGADYIVVFDPDETIDGTAITASVRHFSIENRSSQTPPPTVVAIRQEMDSNSTQLAKLGTPAGASISADILTIDNELATAQADLDIITGATGVNLLAATQASIDAIETDTTTDIPAQITALNNISNGDVLTQVNAALDTACAELSQGVPTATPDLCDAVMLLYMQQRNELTVNSTSGHKTISNDSGVVITKKPYSDSGTVYTETEMITGP